MAISEEQQQPEGTATPARGSASLLRFVLGLGLGLIIVAGIYFATAAPAIPAVAQPAGPVTIDVGQVSAMLPETDRNIGLNVGQQAPDFVWKDSSGTETRLSDYRGKAVMINFFATWCAPCRAETPDLQALYQQKQAEGFVVLMVNSDSTESAKQVSDYAQNFRLSLPVLSDAKSLVGKRYQVRGLPTSYFIDKSGIIRDFVPGGLDRNGMLRRVNRLLQQ